jgi:deoxyribonuclease V
VSGWPSSAEELLDAQRKLAEADEKPWTFDAAASTGACFICSSRGKRGAGDAGDPVWAAASGDGTSAVIRGAAGAPYAPGLLALREGPTLERAVRALERMPDVLLVDATGRDHPRRAGLALHLGAVLDLPTVGVTHRPLLAQGAWPPNEAGAAERLVVDGETVGYWLRTRPGTRPLAVHAAWRTDAETAVEIVTHATAGRRTPEPLRRARRLAREARTAGV